MTGPMAAVAAVAPDQMPMAGPRVWGGKLALMSERLPGTRSAAPTPWTRALVDQQRRHLAAARSPDPRIQQAIAESFVHGYRTVLWVTVALALASSFSALFLTNSTKPASPKKS